MPRGGKREGAGRPKGSGKGLPKMRGRAQVALAKEHGLYRPQFLRHRIEAYAASATIESCLFRTAFGVWKPCRAISQVEL
jgi:hypothetical protein